MEKEQEQSRFQVMEKGMKIMSLIQAARHMIQAKHRGEYAHQFDEADLRAKIQTIEQCMKKLRNLDSPKHVKIPRFADVSQVAQAGARDTEDQDFEEEEVVEPKPEMFLTQARREELVELIRRMNTKVQKYKKRQPNLELQLQELREEKYCRQLQWMEKKKQLKEEIGRPISSFNWSFFFIHCSWRRYLLNLPSSKSYGSGGSSPPKAVLSPPKVSSETHLESKEIQFEEERHYTGINRTKQDRRTDMRKPLSHLQEIRAEAKAPKASDLELGPAPTSNCRRTECLPQESR